MNRSYYNHIRCENRTYFWETDTETDILQTHQKLVLELETRPRTEQFKSHNSEGVVQG